MKSKSVLEWFIYKMINHELYLQHKKELKFNPDNFYCNSNYWDKDTCSGYDMSWLCYGCNNVKMRT